MGQANDASLRAASLRALRTSFSPDRVATIYFVYSEEHGRGVGDPDKKAADEALADEMANNKYEENDDPLSVIEDLIHSEVWAFCGEWDGW